eukprot:SAG22_NODE_2937_length_2092_cov_1.322629_3_plen_87_part_00
MSRVALWCRLPACLSCRPPRSPHLPFIVPQAKLDLYPLESISLPANDQPPKDMPPIAWSNSGELVAYSDVNALRDGQVRVGAPRLH